MQPNRMSFRVYPTQSALLKAALVCALLTMVLLLLAFAPAPQHQKLSPSEAKDHIDETATVCGDVVSTRYATSTQGQPTFLNLDKPYPNQIFTVLIWGKNRSRFGTPETDYQTKRICVTGKIAEYRGVPEAVVSNPLQLQVE
jgi:micrococcal nuclease